ncbi:DoxX family protein [Amnibacterium kyonggiense]
MPDPRSIVRPLVAAGFAGMGVTHFVPSIARGMSAMIPPAISRRSPVSARALVRLTGVCEIAGATGLLLRPTRPLAAGALVVFLAAVFPANAVAARDPERFGPVAVPLVPRAAAQVLLAALVVVAGTSAPRVSP